VFDPPHRTIVDGIDFSTALRFPRLLRSVAVALQPTNMVLGLVMVTALMTAGRLWDGVTEATVPTGGLLAPPRTEVELEAEQIQLRAALGEQGLTVDEGVLDAREVAARITEAYRARRAGLDAGRVAEEDARYRQALQMIESVRPRGAFEATVTEIIWSYRSIVTGALTLQPGLVARGVSDLTVGVPTSLWRHERGFSVVFGLLLLLVVAFGGGAISRRAACHWSGSGACTMREAVDFAVSRFWKLLTALLLPLLLTVLAALVIAVLGLLMRLPWLLEVVGALAFGAALLLGALLAFLLVGYALAVPMLVPAVACESCDAADAQQRAYAYLLHRPLHLLGYGITSLVGLALGTVVVGVFVVVALNATAMLFASLAGDRIALEGIGGVGLLQLGSDSVPLPGSRGEAWSGSILTFWQTAMLCLVPAFVLSYLFVASTLIYLFMRRACDGQDLREIWRPGLVPGTQVPLEREDDEAAEDEGDRRRGERGRASRGPDG
jgi:hypothetical protein